MSRTFGNKYETLKAQNSLLGPLSGQYVQKVTVHYLYIHIYARQWLTRPLAYSSVRKQCELVQNKMDLELFSSTAIWPSYRVYKDARDESIT